MRIFLFINFLQSSRKYVSIPTELPPTEGQRIIQNHHDATHTAIQTIIHIVQAKYKGLYRDPKEN